MANILDANPDLRIEIDHHRERSRMVPLAKDGEFHMLIHRDYEASEPLPVPLPVADYVVGLELLGVTFHVIETNGRRALQTGIIFEPPAWVSRASQLVQAFGPGRENEIADFLAERGDRIIRTSPAAATT